MGRYSKGIGKHKVPRSTVSAEVRVVRKAAKLSKYVSSEGMKRAEKIQKNVMRAVIGLSYMYFSHIMHVSERVSSRVIGEMITGIQRKMGCVNEKLTTWEDIEKYEIKSTDKEFWPVKWTDYQHIQHDYGYMLTQTDAKTDNEIINAITKTEVIRYTEFILHHFELALMSALHDYYGYGLKRLKRIILLYRKMLYLPRERLHDIVQIVRGYKIFFPDETDDAILEKSERFWSVCLLDPEWEGQYLVEAAA